MEMKDDETSWLRTVIGIVGGDGAIPVMRCGASCPQSGLDG